MLLCTSNTLKSLKTKCIYIEMNGQTRQIMKNAIPLNVSMFILDVFSSYTSVIHPTPKKVQVMSQSNYPQITSRDQLLCSA